MDLESISPLSPINFFQLSLECKELPKKKKKNETFCLNEKLFSEYELPATYELSTSPHLGDVAMGWSVEGIEVLVRVKGSFKKSSFPNITSGDSLEVFIDTRDIKTSGHNTRFCHHFFFFPEPLEGRQAGEITRFRTEDSHDLCDPEELKVHSFAKSSDSFLQIFIPSSCLNGYDPGQYDRLGFTYRLNFGGLSQDFSVLSSEYQMEQQPSLWSSLKLIS